MTHLMWQYIDETPQCAQTLLRSHKDRNTVLHDLFTPEINEIIFVGSGSSLNAAQSALWAFEAHTHYIISYMTPSRFVQEQNVNHQAIVFAISQTGNSRTTLEAVKWAQALGLGSCAITGNEASKIARLCDCHISLHCGAEESNAKTKGVTLTIMLVHLIAFQLSNRLDSTQKASLIQDIEQVIQSWHTMKQSLLMEVVMLKKWGHIDNLSVVGPKHYRGLIDEMALKISETMCIPSLASDDDEFTHGLHRSVSLNTNLIWILDDDTQEDSAIIKTLATQVRNLLVVSCGDTHYDNSVDVIYLKGSNWMTKILSLTLLTQILATYLPDINGLDPNRPCNEYLVDANRTRV